MKKKISIPFLILLFLITSFLSIFLFSCISESDIKVSEPELKEKIIEEESDDIIRYFFELIDQGITTEAADLLDSSLAPDSNSKQQWKSAFDGFESVEVTSKEPFNEQSWTDSYRIYKVGLNIEIKPERMQELINWNGQGIRWISIIKTDDTWRIGAIATGP
ncbi:hypothetical protein MUO74_05265 [Candidatus Bathyarchaeota archaeon]|jgi:hypothetical protein|nr:hypothetical protein [Candidatus Bathyarchaeota archaeon]